MSKLGSCPLTGYNPGLLLAFSLDIIPWEDIFIYWGCHTVRYVGVEQRIKPQPTFFASVKLCHHSDMYECIWAASSWSQRTLRVQVWGSPGTLVKQQDSHKLIWGTKGPLFKAYVHRDQEVPNPITINQSIIHVRSKTMSYERSVDM